MKLTVLGGVGEYGRSCFLLENKEFAIMVDCGVLRTQADVSKRYPRITSDIAKKIDAVFLTHSHEDHSAALPYLYHLGYKGKVYASEPTICQAYRYVKEWQAYENQRGWMSPYTDNDREKIDFVSLKERDANTWIPFSCFSISFMYGRAGHIAGSVWYMFKDNNNQTIFFSGDYSFESNFAQYDLPPIGSKIKLAIMDGAYGIENTPQRELVENIINEAEDILARGKNILIPVPMIGRSFELFSCFANRYQGETLFIDYDLAKSMKDQLKNPFWIRKEAKENLISNFTESIKINRKQNKRIYFVLERDVQPFLEEVDSDCFEVLFSGPRHSPLLRMLATSFHHTPIHYAKYHVHPRLDETEILVKRLNPARIVFTHNREEVVRELREHIISTILPKNDVDITH